MRLLLAALLASVMLAGAAEARIAVIAPIEKTAGTEYDPEWLVSGQRDMRLLRETLDGLGAKGNYVVLTASTVTTEMVRTGLVYYRRTSTFGWDADGPSEQFDGIIIPTYPGYVNTTAAYAVYPNIRFDSLTRVARGGPLVPHLYLLTNTTLLKTSAYLSSNSAATRCSVGVADGEEKANPTWGQVIYPNADPTLRWFPHTYTSGWPVTYTPVGGLRKVLQLSTSGFARVHSVPFTAQSQWPDSTPFYLEDNDTTLVWDRLWADLASCPGAKTMTFCDYYGAGLVFDSLSNFGTPVYRNGNNEGDLSVLRFGLAHYDSLLGGRLFTNKDAAVRGILVSHSNGRGLRRWMGGIAPSDTAAYYSSLDSLTKWGVPITFGLNVNPDTLSTYARDLIKLKTVPQARFTPYVVDGVLDTSATSIGAGAAAGTTRNKTRWVDVFGRWRRRVMVGPGGLADTSLSTQLSYMRAFTDSVTGRPTVRVLAPPYDDWSPGAWGQTSPYVAKNHGRLYADSAMYAMRVAGFLGVLANGQSPECDLSVSSGVGYTNPRGFIGTQGWYRPKFNGTTTDATTGIVSYAGATMDPFMVLTHAGSSMGLGQTQEVMFDDSTGARTDGAIGYLGHTLDRANGGFWTDRWFNADEWFVYGVLSNANWWTKPWIGVVFPYDDLFYPPRRSHVLKLFASDLSGDPGNPARTGLYVIRSLQQSFRATNMAAGRTLVRLGYLDEVRP